jgi:PAS domain-containing protein
LTTSLAAIRDFAYVFDLDGRFKYANKSQLDLWGLTLKQAVGKDFIDLDYPASLAVRLQQQIEQVILTRQTVADEAAYEGPTGVGGYYEYIFSPICLARRFRCRHGEGRGARFTVRLPHLERAAAVDARGLSGIDIVLVEDDVGTRQATSMLLRQHGAQVREPIRLRQLGTL